MKVITTSKELLPVLIELGVLNRVSYSRSDERVVEVYEIASLPKYLLEYKKGIIDGEIVEEEFKLLLLESD